MAKQKMEHPKDQTRGEPLFLINYINIFNPRGQLIIQVIIEILIFSIIAIKYFI